jgi:hypothetical protein
VPGLPGGLLLPQARFKDFQQPPKALPRCERPDHYTEWTRCAKQGIPTCLPIEFAAQLTEVALLGTLALRTGKVIEWDAANMRSSDPEANRLVDPPYREGWQLPKV